MNAGHDEGVLGAPLPSLDDAEGLRVPDGLPPVIDTHVHLFPDELFGSVWAWFDRFGWPIRYRMTSEQVIGFLLDRGIYHIIGLHYAHKPGIARSLNAYMAGLSQSFPRLTATATVFPGEHGCAAILRDAFASGLKGVKLHAHVQCFDLADPMMTEIFRICSDSGMPLIIHAGREPKSPAYGCDPYRICSAQRVARVLAEWPELKMCVPHLGADEFNAYRYMLEKFDTLWVDTTMMMADYLPGLEVPPIDHWRPDRLMFGTDFPNLPYAWDRELQKISAMNLKRDFLDGLCWRNALQFMGIDLPGIFKQTRNV